LATALPLHYAHTLAHSHTHPRPATHTHSSARGLRLNCMGNLHKLPAVVWRRFPLSTRPRPPKLCGQGVLQFNERVQINLKRQLNPFFSGFGQIFATPPWDSSQCKSQSQGSQTNCTHKCRGKKRKGLEKVRGKREQQRATKQNAICLFDPNCCEICLSPTNG